MAKLTVLEIVQDILNSMDSDEVNSINDTLEATQVAQIVKTTYYNIIDGKDYQHLYQLFQPDTSGVSATPTKVKLPQTVIDVRFVKYNKRTLTDTKDRVEKVTYKTPEEFLDIVNARNSAASNVTVVSDTVSLNIFTDAAPTYYTSFDGEYLILDSYDSEVDSTIQSSKFQCYGRVRPTFTISDSFIPDLPEQMFSYLLNEAKATAFVDLKQTQNPKAEQHSLSQKRRMSQENWRLAGGIKFPDYGRRK